MRYVLLAYADERQLATPGAEYGAGTVELWQSGQLLAAEGLHLGRMAATVRLQGGALSVDNGPLVASAEQIVGLFVISATDLNDAIRLAAKLPQARDGPIEIRPVQEESTEHRT